MNSRSVSQKNVAQMTKKREQNRFGLKFKALMFKTFMKQKHGSVANVSVNMGCFGLVFVGEIKVFI